MNKRLDIKIIVVTHKPYWMPRDDVYLPLHVGKALHPDINLGIQTDDTGDNISDKNTSYCELTGLYWAWKNLKADYKGIVHYRRHFVRKGMFSTKDDVFRRVDFEKILSSADILLPHKRHYYIETNESHYIHAHYAKDLSILREAVSALYPQYITSFDKQMKRTSAHMFNIMVMRSELFDAYCEWLFSILSVVETKIDTSRYDSFQCRVYGFLSELLLDVWIDTNHLKYREAHVAFLERISWIKKGGDFLLRKFFPKHDK